MRNADAVCLACLAAGGALNATDIEHIAIEAYEIAPSQFCWNHYPDRIDLRKVQYALKNEALSAEARVKGSLKDGYQLTPFGLQWSSKEMEAVRSDTDGDSQGVATKIEAERRRLKGTSAFRKHTGGQEDAITRQDYYAFVRINDYFPDTLRAQRFARIDNVVSGDADLERVWSSLKSAFGGNQHDR